MIEPFTPLSGLPPTDPRMLAREAVKQPRFWLWIALAAFLGFGAGVVISVVALVVLAVVSMSSVLTVEFDEPRAAVVGEPFVVSLAITNPNMDTVQFSGIDIPDEFFDSFTIESLSPAALSGSPVRGFGMREYYFERDLPPDAKERIELTVVPTRSGSHTMQFDVCSSGMYCATVWRTVEVAKKP